MKKKDFLFILLIFFFPLMDALRYGYVVDDAFISFRYANNLANGFGLVFNTLEKVEGYTNFLWTLLLTPSFWFGIDPLLYSRVLSTLAGFGTLLVLVGFQRKRSPSLMGAVFIAPILLAAHASFSVWLHAGLETQLFTFLVTAGTLSFLSNRGERSGSWPVILVLAALTRPEGLLFLVITWFVFVTDRIRNKKAVTREELFFIFIPLIFLYVPYLVWKYLYYGSLIPNTFYAKVGSDVSQLTRGLWYVKTFLGKSGSFLFAMPLLLLLFRESRSFLGILSLYLLPYCLYVILVGGDVMVKFRFILPVLPLFYLLIAESLLDVSEKVPRRDLSRAFLFILTLSSLVLTIDLDRDLVVRRREMVKDWIETGKWLGLNYPSDTVIALGAIGAIPFYSRLPAIDIFGLTEPHIARTEAPGMGRGLPGHERSDGAYVLARDPDLILPKVVLTDHPPGERELPGLFSGSRAEMEIWGDRAFRNFYSPVIVRLDRGYFTFFERPEEE